jgi:hypothetical protein
MTEETKDNIYDIKEVLPVDEVCVYVDDIDMNHQKWKEKVMKCKLLCLADMGLNPMMNPKYLDKRKKTELEERIKEKMEEREDNTNEQFNILVCDTLLSQDANYFQYPIYCMPNTHKIVPLEKNIEEDCSINIGKTD